jgi:UDP-2,3-diacylglucosamine pyrophosphatase LpxH
LGLEFVERLELEVGGKKMLFIHFHQFDPFIFKHPWITDIAERIYYFFQSVDRTRKFSRWLKRTSKSFLKLKSNIRDKALEYISDKPFDCIFGGHIHFAEIYDNGDKEYYNSGSFCDDPCHYLLIDSKGIVTLKEI